MKAEDPILDKTSPDYIKGASYKGFCVPSSKLNLGAEFDYTVMGIFSIYEEKVKRRAKATSEIPPIVGYRMPKQAQRIPIAEGSYFDREFVAKDGEAGILSPVFWVFGLIKGHEEMGLHNMVFRSTAAGNAKLQKILAKNGGISCQQVVHVVAEKKEFPAYKSVTFRPLFEETDRLNFQVKGDTIIPKSGTKLRSPSTFRFTTSFRGFDYTGSRLVSEQIADAVKEIPEHTSNKF